jgi:hypothetical protein
MGPGKTQRTITYAKKISLLKRRVASRLRKHLRRRDATLLIASYRLESFGVTPDDEPRKLRAIRNAVNRALKLAIDKPDSPFFAESMEDRFLPIELLNWARHYYKKKWGIEFNDLPLRSPRIYEGTKVSRYVLPTTIEGCHAELARLIYLVSRQEEELDELRKLKEENRERARRFSM